MVSAAPGGGTCCLDGQMDKAMDHEISELTGALGLTTTLGGAGCGARVGVAGPPPPPWGIGAPPSCEGTNGDWPPGAALGPCVEE